MGTAEIRASRDVDHIRVRKQEGNPVIVLSIGEGSYPGSSNAYLNFLAANRVAYRLLEAIAYVEASSHSSYEITAGDRIVHIDTRADVHPIHIAIRGAGADRRRHSYVTLPQAKKLAYRLLETVALAS